MKHLLRVGTIAITIISLSSCSETGGGETATKDSTATATTSPAATTTPPMDSAAKMKAWMDYMTPGEPHKMLAASNGRWKTETTMWMEPGAPPQTSTGEATNSMIMDGRYQRTVHKSSMMGQPFMGEGLTAYDNAKKVFMSTWVDNMGTGIMQLEGPWDEATRSITLKGTCKDAATGQDMTVREVFTMVDATHEKLEMYCTQNGKEFKNMEMTMTKM